jgi:cobalt-zinc-cadmium efflux system protein
MQNEHDHGHDHGHGHNHDITAVKGSTLAIVVALNFLITVVQIIGGLYAGSLSLISDALHNFSDGVAIIISYLAIRISAKGSDENRSFGYKRATILAALLNSFALIAIAVFLFREAYFKFMNPTPINGGLVFWVALVGLIANLIGVLLLQKGAKSSLNIKSSYLHLLSDSLSSVGVMIGGIIIYYFQIYWIDPALTVAIAFYVLFSSFGIVRKAVHILMQGAPEHVELKDIVADILAIKGVEGIHHVHIWSLDEHSAQFEAHVNVEDMMVSETASILEQIEHELLHYDINHVTIQFEFEGHPGDDLIKNHH